MPINKAARFRFDIIDECLRNTKKKWSKSNLLHHINNRLQIQYGIGVGISLSQLRYDLESMKAEYGAPIEMHREGRNCFYKYDDPLFSIKAIPIKNDELTKLKDAINILKQIGGFPILNEVNEIIKKIENKYVSEDPHDTPNIIVAEMYNNTDQYLEDIYHAIIRKNVLKLTYFSDTELFPGNVIVHPYFLKYFEQGWYLIGYCNELKEIHSFDLEDLQEIRVIGNKFIERPKKEIDHFLNTRIGVSIPLTRKQPEEIYLLFSPSIKRKITKRPIHQSQKTVAEYNDGSIKVCLNLVINSELISKLLSFGKQIKILSPSYLVYELFDITKDLFNYYNNLWG